MRERRRPSHTTLRVLFLVALVGMPISTSTAATSSNGDTPSASLASQMVRSQSGGWDLVTLRTAVKQVVTLRASFPAGDRFAPIQNHAIPSLVGLLLDKGTTRQTKFEIAAKLEGVGAQISFGVDGTMLHIHAKCLSKDLSMLIELLAEELQHPRFDPDEVEKTKKQWIGNLRRQWESTDYRAAETFARALYPEGHPNHVAALSTLTVDIESATIDQLKAFHAAAYGPESATLVMVGDLDSAQVKQDVARAFRSWSGGLQIKALPSAGATGSASNLTIQLDDKPSVSVIWGQRTGMKFSDQDAMPLRVGSAILGRGFTGRLMARVRDEEGLTYGIRGGLEGDLFSDGDFRITASFAPDLLEKGMASVHREFATWCKEGVTAEELSRAKSDLIGSYKVGLATTDGMAEAIISALHRDGELKWLDDYITAIETISLETVNRAIQQHLSPAKMTLVLAGTVSPQAASQLAPTVVP